jgi:hypothetical protein
MIDSEKFDWIKARQECSLTTMFERLRQQVSADVDQRKKLLRSDSHYSFEFVSEKTNIFSVAAVGNQIHCRVQFSLEGNGIQIRSDGFQGTPVFLATLTLNDEGDCRFVVDEIEREFWHIRKMALETLFFQAY